MSNRESNISQHKNFEISISKEELNELPIEKYEGEIFVVDQPEEVRDVINLLSKSPIVGFDTETKPTFQKGHINNVALLQLASPQACYLIRISKIGLIDEVKEFLENENIFKVGLSIKDDFHNLSKIKEIKPGGFLDLQNYVKEFGITDCSLTKIHGILFGKRISKSQQLTNWEAGNLTQKQKEYAALDAMACINIYNKLKSGEFIPENSPYYKPKEPLL